MQSRSLTFHVLDYMNVGLRTVEANTLCKEAVLWKISTLDTRDKRVS